MKKYYYSVESKDGKRQISSIDATDFFDADRRVRLIYSSSEFQIVVSESELPTNTPAEPSTASQKDNIEILKQTESNLTKEAPQTLEEKEPIVPAEFKIWLYLFLPLFVLIVWGALLGPGSSFGRALIDLGAIYGGLILLLLIFAVLWGIFIAGRMAVKATSDAIDKEKETGKIRGFLKGAFAFIWYAFVAIAVLVWLSRLFSGGYDPDVDPADYYRR